MEEELGVKLFHRSKHSIILTEDGLLLKRRAQEILSLAEKTREEFIHKGLMRLAATLIACCGVMSWIKHDITSYLFLQNEFVFFDVTQPLILFWAEYLSIMGMWIWLIYYIRRFLQRKAKKGGI